MCVCVCVRAQYCYFIQIFALIALGEFVIDKVKAQLPGCSLPAELPITLREYIPFIRFLTCDIAFLTDFLCLQAAPQYFSSQRQDISVLS